MLLAPAIALAAEPSPPTISVDLREASRGIFHAALTFPVKPGPLTLVYPRWIPGDHLPSGPIENLAGLRFTANGQPVAWKRDVFDASSFHLVVPDGATTLNVSLDYLAEPVLSRMVNDVGNATTPNLALLRWHSVLLYPQGARPSALQVKADVRLPQGWTLATAPRPLPQSGDITQFAPMSLERLVDSPVIAGRFVQSHALGTIDKAPIAISLVGDDPASIALSDRQTTLMRAVVGQTQALFGSVVFDQYRYLVTLSDTIRRRGIGGQEHHESSDNTGVSGIFRSDDDDRWASLMAHELAHAWNGKYRRPIGEATADYQQPYDNSLLWVYEGLTSYLGNVLSARAGALKPDAFRAQLATLGADMAHRSGRRWRSLSDTGTGLTALMHAGPDGANWRRSIDYYFEGILLWLEIDLKIQALTQDRRSLDDFCQAFFAKDPARDPLVKPYDRQMLVDALNRIAPFDWDGYLTQRVDGISTSLPHEAFAQSGWSLAYRDVPLNGAPIDPQALLYALGFTIGDDGRVTGLEKGGAADLAGLDVGARLLSVNGAAFSRAGLERGVADRQPLTLIVARADKVSQIRIDNTAGPRVPVLERAGGPDRLAAIIAPRTTKIRPPTKIMAPAR